MGKHTTPQAYLRGFSYDEEAVCVYDTHEGCWRNGGRPIPVERVAQRSAVWNSKAERRLTPDEVLGWKALVKIGHQEAITTDERLYAAFYLAHMMSFRSDRGWSEFTKLAEPELETLKDNLDGEEQVSSLIDRELREIRKGPQKGKPSLFAREVLVETAVGVVFNIVLRMRWTVWRANRGHQFVTCDAPVWYTDTVGMGRTCGHVWFPLDRTTLLLADWGKYKASHIRYLETREVSRYNRLIVGSAFREVFAPEPFAWMPRAVDNMKDPRRVERAQFQLAAKVVPVWKSKVVACRKCGLRLTDCACLWGLLRKPEGSFIIGRDHDSADCG